ncbi:MAG: tetratricopeptide repeat protein [Myxococcales bacterium]|nr:tetratricopeptide repeat protein [Myxococcales bacterium]
MDDLQSIIDEALDDARDALVAGDLPEAETLVREVLAVASGQSRAHGLLGRVALRCGDTEEARRHLQQAFESGDEDPDVLRALADLCWSALDFDNAARALARLASASAPDPGLWHRVGVSRHRTGDVPAALAALERAVAIAGAPASAWGDLGVARAGLADLAGAEAALETACRLASSDERPTHLAHLAGVKARAFGPQPAVALLKEAAGSGVPWITAAYAQALSAAGDVRAALATLRAAHAEKPGAFELWLPLGALALAQGDAQEALTLARERLALHPSHAGAVDLYLQAVRGGARPPDQAPDPAWLLAVSWIRATPLIDGALAAALAEHVAQHRTLRLSPYGHATQGGWHSGSLLVAPRGPVALLEPLLAEAIAHYGRAAWGPPPGRVALNPWGVVFRGEGHQSSHIHPDSWLSGVLHVELPPGMHEPPRRAAKQGWLRFTEGPRPEDPVVLDLEPVVGTLVLFPSYLHHQTLPVPLPEPRISIAFDVVPVEGN